MLKIESKSQFRVLTSYFRKKDHTRGKKEEVLTNKVDKAMVKI